MAAMTGPKLLAVILPNRMSNHTELSRCPFVLSAIAAMSSLDNCSAPKISSALEYFCSMSLTLGQGKDSVGGLSS